MKTRKTFWGLFFILAAVLIGVNQLGYLNGINVWTLLATIFLVPIIIKSATKLNFFGIFFGFAGLGIIYGDYLNIMPLGVWGLLLMALFLSIGFSIIFSDRIIRKSNKFRNTGNPENFASVINSPDESEIDFSVNFSSSIKYINTKEFKKANLSCSFGALKVYFDNAELSENGAEIKLDISFGGVELFIPKKWRVVNELNVNLAGVEEKNASMPLEGGPAVRLTGDIRLSGIEIIYV